LKSGKIGGNFFDRYDFFSSEPPTFNVEGYKRFGTPIGFCLTILFTILTIIYGFSAAYFSYSTAIIFQNENESEVSMVDFE
jgi:hypothetical protein